MAKTNSDGYGPGDFLVVEDPDKPTTWHLQVKRNGTPDHGLMGAAWAALFSPGGHRGNKYEGPNSDEAKAALKALYKSEGMDTPTVDHSIEPFEADLGSATFTDDLYVIRRGKIFECGEYPDKAFSLDSGELKQAVASFTPVDIDLEHVDTVLQGKLGTLLSIEADPDGKSVIGEVALPSWLDRMLDEGERKVSASWDRTTKTLNRLALVRSPRISDAALFAAFSAGDADFARKRHDTATGQDAIQQLHDLTTRHGAVCNQPATMASRHEHSAIQHMHNVSVSHGATCATLAVPPNPSYFSGTPLSTQPHNPHRSPHMKLIDWITGKAKEDGIDLDETDLQAVFSNTNPELEAQFKSELEARDAKIAAFEAIQRETEARFAKLTDERQQAEAATFATSLVGAMRITPIAAEKLVPLAVRIAATDSTANFAEGDKSTSDLLREFCEALPDLSIFTTEHIPQDKVAALFNDSLTDGVSKPKEVSQERIDALLKTTASGRAVLAERAKSNGH